MKKDMHDNSVVTHNIHSLLEVRQKHEAYGSSDERLAAMISRFIGSLHFVYFNLIWFGGWIVLNLGIFGNHPWDPFPLSNWR